MILITTIPASFNVLYKMLKDEALLTCGIHPSYKRFYAILGCIYQVLYKHIRESVDSVSRDGAPVGLNEKPGHKQERNKTCRTEQFSKVSCQDVLLRH